jgi:hypothetical protein
MSKTHNNVLTHVTLTLETVKDKLPTIVRLTKAGVKKSKLATLERNELITLPKMFPIEKKLLIEKLKAIPAKSDNNLIISAVTKEFNKNRRLLLRTVANLPSDAITKEVNDEGVIYNYNLPFAPEIPNLSNKKVGNTSDSTMPSL